MTRKVNVIGVGMVPFAKPGKSEEYNVMAAKAGRAALEDAKVPFSSVQQAATVYDPDPFDVPGVHADAREAFEDMVGRATRPSFHGERGRMLLVLGDSGAGKTHLLRAFRRYVHEYGRGFVAYAHLQSNTDDYPRYLLTHVVDSLTKPYAGPAGDRTGLHELASGSSSQLSSHLTSKGLLRLPAERIRPSPGYARFQRAKSKNRKRRTLEACVPS